MTSIQKNTIIILTIILASLLAVASYFGAFVTSTYERDAVSSAQLVPLQLALRRPHL